MGVPTRDRTSGGGEDHRPGRGSELLRLRPACHDSSSSATGDLMEICRLRDGPAWDWSVCIGGGWLLDFSFSLLTVSKEEVEGKRDNRILGRRTRFVLPGARRVASGGLDDEGSAGCCAGGFSRALDSSTVSKRSMEATRNRGRGFLEGAGKGSGRKRENQEPSR